MVGSKDTTAKTKPLISKENVQNRPETIQRETVLGVSAFREQTGNSAKGGVRYARMPKYLKREWQRLHKGSELHFLERQCRQAGHPNHECCGKGITLTEDEGRNLYAALKAIYEKE